MALLLDSLNTKLISWTKWVERLVVMRPVMSPADIPTGVGVTEEPLQGKRVVVKDKRYYGNIRGLCAEWPEDEMHEWDGNKIITVLSGKAEMRLGNYSFQCPAGYSFVLPAGTPQQNNITQFDESRDYCELLFVLLHTNAVQCFIRCASPHEHRGRGENYLFTNAELVLLFRAFFGEILGGRADHRQFGAEILTLCWKTMQRELEEKRYVVPGVTAELKQPKQRQSDFEADLSSYIQSRLPHSPSLTDAARGMRLSRSQFVSQMQKEIGKTYIEFLTEYRIEEAKVLLRETEWTNVAIASMLGFSNGNYFSTVFRRAVGKTPQQYRQDFFDEKL